MNTGPADFVALAAERLTQTEPSPRDQALAGLLTHIADTWWQQPEPLRTHARAVARAINEERP